MGRRCTPAPLAIFAEGRVPLKSPPGMRTQTTKEKTMKDIALFVVGMFLITIQT